tara:strand:+ start:307 stop:480 length:174 start_codon:yes stop_codon:yes gene_type:complete
LLLQWNGWGGIGGDDGEAQKGKEEREIFAAKVLLAENLQLSILFSLSFKYFTVLRTP